MMYTSTRMTLRSGKQVISSVTIPVTRVVFVDFETTGLNPFKDDIIEIAAIDNIGNTYQTLVKPGRKIPAESTAIHGITDDMVEKEGCDVKSAVVSLLAFIHGEKGIPSASYLVGHNICNFDMPFLKSTIERCNEAYRCKYELSKDIRIIDTMRMSQRYTNIRVHNLGYLSKVYSITMTNAHRALSDIRATQAVYDRIMKEYTLTPDKVWLQTKLV